MEGLPISCGENRFCLSSLFGALVFVLGVSQYARLCYILVPDNNHCMGFSGFLGFFQPNPQTRNPYPKNIPTTGKEKSTF